MVLIFSSLTMSGAIQLSRLGWQRGMVRCMLATAALGTLFLVLKGTEYHADYEEHLMPFLTERPYALDHLPASRLFINLYYAATGLHALHLFNSAIANPAGADPAGDPAGLPRRPPEPDRDLRPVLALHRPDLDHGVPVLYVLNR